MNIYATLILMPTPSSRAAEQTPTWEGEREFSHMPAKGDMLRLGEDWGDWADYVYMVDAVEWLVPLNGSSHRPTITALRLS